MECVVWNCRGVGGRSFSRLLLDLKHQYGFKFLALLETRQNSARAISVSCRLGFDYSNFVEAQGFSGGIWCFWESSINFTVLTSNSQFVHGVITGSDNLASYVTIVYGSPNVQVRRSLWNSLHNFSESIADKS